ncbi:MAG TPA: nitrilase-related carbon-nitrogen hydrolase, partial [Rhizomicrobium sp.]|nr:nitrilase-related carbon-nitrogen hydrolase [Rhizomicrobium sp.]
MSNEARLRIGLAQLNFLVGDAQGNAARVIDSVARASTALKPDLLVFPELTLSGYPPEDLLFHGGFRQAIDRALAAVRDAVRGTGVIVGYPEYVGRDIYNSAALLCDGALIANHRKRELPNYKVFDEKRYFRAGSDATVFEHRGFRIGLLVCEDLWECEAARQARDAGA